MKHKEWYLKWHVSITQDIFKRIVSHLESLGLKPFKHCQYTPTYKSFKDGGYLRSKTADCDEKGDFCVDNNTQRSTMVEVRVEDILNYYSSNYEIY